MTPHYQVSDTIILGGGLAGLCCALQLKQQIPALSITVLERRPLPYPEATHKVGESTVEIGAHYFSETLGLKDHLKTQQLRKLGIRLFFSSKDNQAIEQRSEMGANRYFHVPTYQIDRGRFENHIISRLKNLGVTVLSPARITDMAISETDQPHTVTLETEGVSSLLAAKWIIDASGRSSILKRKLNLELASEHDSNAVWFRVAGKLNIDDWSNNPAWRSGHDGDFSRWFSTNHLTGEGYWVWIIPLSSDYTSIGVVTDPKLHPLTHFKTYEDTLNWLDRYEPQCARALRTSFPEPADYLAVKHYSRKCSRVLSPNRWAITGDAGVFLDPLYSPGSDFIGIQNTFITDCIARDFNDARFIGRCEVYNNLYTQLTDGFLKTFLGQYPVFGNPRVMPLKVVWDYTVYWGFLAPLAIQDRLCDVAVLKAIEESIATVYTLNEEMQGLLRAQHDHDDAPVTPSFLDISQIPFLFDLNKRLLVKHSHESFTSQLQANIRNVEDVFTRLKEIMTTYHSKWSSNEELLDLLKAIPAAEAIAA